MNQKYWLNKKLVIGILVLFIGASFVSAVDIKSENVSDTKDITQLNINCGLIGYWSFDFETADDESCNVNNGIIHEAIAVDGISGRGFQFDGIDDYIDILETNDFGFANKDLTFSAWIQIADNANHYRAFIALADEDDRYGLPKIILGKSRSGWQEGRIYYELQTLTENILVFSNENGNTLPKNEWIYLTGVIDYPDSLKLYVNAEFQDCIDLINFNMSDATSLKLNFGSTPFPGYDWEYGRLAGSIDEVRIYNRALTEKEIKSLYNNPAGLKDTIIIGRISNLNTDVGNLNTFNATSLFCFQFSPFKFIRLKSGETIKISNDYRGLLSKNLAIGIFQANI